MVADSLRPIRWSSSLRRARISRAPGAPRADAHSWHAVARHRRARGRGTSRPPRRCGSKRRRVGRRGFAILTSHFTREVCNFCEKVANHLHRTPTFKSVIIDERSMKKSFFFSRILNYRRKVLQKLSLQKSLFTNTVKREGFDSSKLRIFTMG